jgi:peptide/nickel transport system substrate-binding protein
MDTYARAPRIARACGLGALTLLALACAREAPRSSAVQVAVLEPVRGFKPGYSLLESENTTGALVFESLIARGDGLDVRPWLAVRWSSPDSLRWTLTLKRGVRFHDGRPFGSADVVRSWVQLLRDTAGADAPPTAFLLVDGASEVLAGKAASIRGVRAVNDSTLEITLLRREPGFLRTLGSMRLGIAGASSREWAPVGTGPWRLAGGRAGDSTFHFVRYGDYHAGRAASESLIVRVMSPDAFDRGFAGGRIDCADDLTAGITARLATHRSLRLMENPQLARVRAWMTLRNPALRDVRVRRALLLALDRSHIVSQLRAANITITDGVVPPELFRDTTPVTPYAPDSARLLLASAGFSAERPLTLIVPRREPNAAIKDMNSPLAEYWAAVGIDVRAEGAEDFGAPTALQPSDIEVWVDETGVPTPEEYLNTAAIEPPYSSPRTTPFWSPETFRALYAQARATTDTARRNLLRQQLVHMLHDSMPGLPLFFVGSTDVESIHVSDCNADSAPYLTSRVLSR